MTFQIEVKVPIDGTGKYEIKGKEMEFLQQFASEFPKKRGEIINVSLMVEQNVEQVIRRAKRDMDLTLVFDEFGDMVKQYTFKDKIEDFRTITKNSSFPLKKDFKQLRKDLHQVMSKRNKYTHGNLYYDGGLRKHIITFEENGKQEAEVSFEIIDNDLKFISGILSPIEEIVYFFDLEYRKNRNLD